MEKKSILNPGVIIVAGGSGTRMGSGVPKQFRIAGGEPLLARSINTFAAALPTARIVVVLPAAYIDYWRDLSARFNVARHITVPGGEQRFHSVKAGLEALPEDTGFVMIHDAVRALCTKKLIIRALQCATENGSAVPAVVPADSFRIVDDNGSHPTDRNALRIVQTPQVFRFGQLKPAYETDFDPAFTDDASVAERAGIRIALCEGERRNIKITTPEDMAIAEAILENDDENISL